jgi:hypothetical protein
MVLLHEMRLPAVDAVFEPLAKLVEFAPFGPHHPGCPEKEDRRRKQEEEFTHSSH